MPASLYRVTPNDFPCDGPVDMAHLLLQSHVPILDRSLASDDAEWDDVVARGLLFLTGMLEHEQRGIGLNVARELRQLIVSLWPEDRFETIVWVRRRCGYGADAAGQSRRSSIGQGHRSCASARATKACCTACLR